MVVFVVGGGGLFVETRFAGERRGVSGREEKREKE